MEVVSRSLQPGVDDTELGDTLIRASDVQETILLETIISGENGDIHESGRTACGSVRDLRRPITRFRQSVELASCPVGKVGIWHTHPTTRGLTNPEHSLPDWANVVFHGVDASVVVGTQTSELVVSSLQKDEMTDEFRNALGIDARSTRDVVDAVRSGQIHDPPAARERVRSVLSPCVSRHNTSFPELEARVRALSVPARDTIHACGSVHAVVSGDHLTHDDGRRSLGLHRRAKACTGTVSHATAGVNVRELAIATVIGNVVGTLTNRWLLGKDA